MVLPLPGDEFPHEFTPEETSSIWRGVLPYKHRAVARIRKRGNIPVRQKSGAS
jgi:hypothetical protein